MEKEFYKNWHPCFVTKYNQEYHIVQDGIINKEDYVLLFEGEDKKHHIPTEVVDQMNIYGNVGISSSVINFLSKENIRLLFMNNYGELVGTFMPEGHNADARILISQVLEYVDEEKRCSNARYFEEAAFHNMRAVLRYYKKKGRDFDSQIEFITEKTGLLKAKSSVDEMMLVEARVKQVYYHAFNEIIQDDEFLFVERSKRPPKDRINALISFGNTLLYNEVLKQMCRTSLTPQIGVVHASNKRPYSLHFDFADVLKPILVDRVIFSIINKKQIKTENFRNVDDGGVYLDYEGKKIFINSFEEKLNSALMIEGKKLTYRQLIGKELRLYQKHFITEEKYKPYKYY